MRNFLEVLTLWLPLLQGWSTSSSSSCKASTSSHHPLLRKALPSHDQLSPPPHLGGVHTERPSQPVGCCVLQPLEQHRQLEGVSLVKVDIHQVKTGEEGRGEEGRDCRGDRGD